MRALVDTGVFYALVADEDAHHLAARKFFAKAHQEQWQLVTTNTVIVETHALMLRRLRNGAEAGLKFLESLDAGYCRQERVTLDDEAAAIALLKANRDKSYSLCDALSFVVARRLGITHAASYDKHFAQWGRLILL
jgi:predicted nucleic acid-binding protein